MVRCLNAKECSVKNCAGAENLPYSQAKKLVFHGFMNAGRRNKAPESETKSTLLLKAITVARISSCVLVFQTPVPPGHCNKDRVIPADAVGCI